MTKKAERKLIEEACDQLVMEGKLVKINPESKEPSYQNVERFLDKVWGVTNRYEICEKCKKEVDLMQNEFLRMDIGGYWVYLHAQCSLPHIGFFAIKRFYEGKKGIKPSKIIPHKMTKAEKDLVIRWFKNESQNTKTQDGSTKK